jgi:hypothetical protein
MSGQPSRQLHMSTQSSIPLQSTSTRISPILPRGVTHPPFVNDPSHGRPCSNDNMMIKREVDDTTEEEDGVKEKRKRVKRTSGKACVYCRRRLVMH